MLVFPRLVLSWKRGEIKRSHQILAKSRLLEVSYCGSEIYCSIGWPWSLLHTPSPQDPKRVLEKTVSSFWGYNILSISDYSILSTHSLLVGWMVLLRAVQGGSILSPKPTSVELSLLATLWSAGGWKNVRNSVLEAECSKYRLSSCPRRHLFTEQSFRCSCYPWLWDCGLWTCVSISIECGSVPASFALPHLKGNTKQARKSTTMGVNRFKFKAKLSSFFPVWLLANYFFFGTSVNQDIYCIHDRRFLLWRLGEKTLAWHIVGSQFVLIYLLPGSRACHGC